MMRISLKFFIGLCSIFLFSLVSGLAGETNNRSGKITAIRNQVSKSGTETNQALDVGHAVEAGETIHTGEQGLTEMKSNDRTTVRLGEKTGASYDPQNRKIQLVQGTIVVDAPSDGGPLVIEVGGVTYTLHPNEKQPQVLQSDIRNKNSSSPKKEKAADTQNSK